MESIKAKLLDDCAQKEVRRFLQVDVFDAGDFDSVVFPDESGDCVFTSETYDLRASDETLVVRVQIAEGAELGQVLRMMAKAISVLDRQTWFKRRCYICDKEMPADTTESVCSPECYASSRKRHVERYRARVIMPVAQGSKTFTRW